MRFGKRCLEVSLNEMIHRQVEMRHSQPPALLWMSAQEVQRFASMRDAISGVAGPVSFEHQQSMRLAKRLLVTRLCRGLDRAGGVVGGAALVSQAAVHVRKPERIGRCQCRLVETGEPGLVRQQHLDAFLETSEEVQRMRVPQRHIQHPAIAVRVLGKPLQPAGGKVEVQNRFRIGVDARGPIRGAGQPAHRLVHEIGAHVVIGKLGGQVVAIAIQPDERFRRAQVQLAACAGQQAVVRDVLRQRVLEDDCGFVGVRFLVQKLEPTQFPQFHRILAAAPDPVQELERYFTTEHGGGLQDVLRTLQSTDRPAP